MRFLLPSNAGINVAEEPFHRRVTVVENFGSKSALIEILLSSIHMPRADKGWAVKRARPSKKVWCSGLGLCLEMSLVFDFGQGLRYDVVCRLDTAAVTELWRLELFSCTSSSFLCAGTLSPRGKCCNFCGRFSWSRQASLSKGFFYYFHDSTTELYSHSATRQCRCYSKTKTTNYCLKHEGKSHPWQN